MSASKSSLWVVYACYDNETRDMTLTQAFAEEKDAFEFMFKNKPARYVRCEKVGYGSSAESVVYLLEDDKIVEIDQGGQKRAVVAVESTEAAEKLQQDKQSLEDELRENSLRIAILRSLMNIDATLKGDATSFGETMLRNSEYRPLSNNSRHISTEFYHKMLINDLVEVKDLNRKLASWIQDLISNTGYQGTVAGLAQKESFGNFYEPTIPFPAPLAELEFAAAAETG